MKTIVATLSALLIAGASLAQSPAPPKPNPAASPAQITYEAKDVVDPEYGITIYEAMNKRLRGDSARQCSISKCNGWVEDYYKNGQLLHKGYYEHG